MLTLVQRTICLGLIVVLIGMTSVALLACQVPGTPAGHEHAIPFTHHHGSSAHASSGAFCLNAVLPAVVGLTLVLAAGLLDAPYRWQSALVVALPFIPPRIAMR